MPAPAATLATATVMQYTPPVVMATDALDQIAAQFFRFDCVQIKQLVSPARLAFFRQLAERIYAEDDRRFASGDRGDPLWLREYDHGWIWDQRLQTATDQAFSLAEIPASRRLYQILDRLLGSDWRPTGANQVRRSAPELRTTHWGSPTQHHFDAQWSNLDHNFCVNVWTPLTHAGRRASGLEFLLSDPATLLAYARYNPERPREPPGEGGINPRFDYECFRPAAIRKNFAPDQFWFPSCEPGDVILFSHWAPHATRAEPGMTETRISLEWRLRLDRFDTPQRPGTAIQSRVY